jgi:hypothetical protein
MAAVICSAMATAAVTSPDVVLMADPVAASSVEAGSAIIAIAESEVAAALSPGCELVVSTFGISVDVGTACLAVRSFVPGLDSTLRSRGAPPATAALGDFAPAAVVGEIRRGWPGIGMS